MGEITPELLAQARMAKSADELMDLAVKNGMELEKESAEQIYAKFHQEAELISDQELDAVSGGGCGRDDDAGCKTLKKDGCPEYWSKMFG